MIFSGGLFNAFENLESPPTSELTARRFLPPHHVLCFDGVPTPSEFFQLQTLSVNTVLHCAFCGGLAVCPAPVDLRLPHPAPCDRGRCSGWRVIPLFPWPPDRPARCLPVSDEFTVVLWFGQPA